jgi:hypothetical protein
LAVYPNVRYLPEGCKYFLSFARGYWQTSGVVKGYFIISNKHLLFHISLSHQQVKGQPCCHTSEKPKVEKNKKEVKVVKSIICKFIS